MYSRIFSDAKNSEDLSACILIDAEIQKKKADIQAMMDEIYQFLNRFSTIGSDAESEYAFLISNLKDFEGEMLKEADSNKKGDWRDPVATTAKLRETIYKVFDPDCDFKQRKGAIDDFQVYARNAYYTTNQKASICQALTSVALMISAATLLLHPPLGAAIACFVVAGAITITAIGFMTRSLLTMNKQDDKRGLAVSNSLGCLNKKRTPNYGTFFNRPAETSQTNLPAAQLASAYKM